MSTAFWSAVCIVLGLGGLAASFVIWRRKGAARGMRAVAWSLIPLAAYLTGAATLLSRIGLAIGSFATSFAFSPRTWTGVIFLALAVALFMASGGLPLLRWRKRRAKARSEQSAGTDARPAVTTKSASRSAAADDDLADVQAILNKHGIK